MSEEDLLQFSGEMPDEITLLTDSDLLNSTTTTPPFTTTTTMLAPIFATYEPNPFRIACLATKSVLIILLLTISCTIRRDFLKFFTFLLLITLFLEAGFDIFTEIHASTAIFGIQPFDWKYLNLQPPPNQTVTEWQKHAIHSYSMILQKYTTYQLYTRDQMFALVSYICGDFFFWSLLFSTITVFFYAHKAVVRPEQIAYEPICSSFLKVQVLPVLFTAIDTLLSIFEIPSYIYISVLFIIRLTACTLLFIITTQIFASLFLFCRSKDEMTKTSPYDQVRNSKTRLFFFVVFTVLLSIFTLPYIVWSALSLAYDVGQILGFNWYIPIHLAFELFPLHITLLMVRPYVFLILVLLLITPYRRRFLKFFCPCCKRH